MFLAKLMQCQSTFLFTEFHLLKVLLWADTSAGTFLGRVNMGGRAFLGWGRWAVKSAGSGSRVEFGCGC